MVCLPFLNDLVASDSLFLHPRHQSVIRNAPMNSKGIPRRLEAPHVPVPELILKKSDTISSQAAFGQILRDISRCDMMSMWTWAFALTSFIAHGVRAGRRPTSRLA